MCYHHSLDLTTTPYSKSLSQIMTVGAHHMADVKIHTSRLPRSTYLGGAAPGRSMWHPDGRWRHSDSRRWHLEGQWWHPYSQRWHSDSRLQHPDGRRRHPNERCQHISLALSLGQATRPSWLGSVVATMTWSLHRTAAKSSRQRHRQHDSGA
jgi:hypothetical protein